MPDVMTRVIRRVLVAALVVWGSGAAAQERTLRVLAGAELVATGALDYLLPRFALKNGVAAEVIEMPPDQMLFMAASGDIDVVLGPDLEAWAPIAGPSPVPGAEGLGLAAPLLVTVPDTGRTQLGAAFHDWLLAGPGSVALSAFLASRAPQPMSPDDPGAGNRNRIASGQPLAQEGGAEPGALRADPAALPGEDLSMALCGRCHVIGARNRSGGIGSATSFGALRGQPGWEEKFLNFWRLNPHPVFTRLDGMSPPFDPDRPPFVAPILLTPEDLTLIVEYVAQMQPRALGPRMAPQ